MRILSPSRVLGEGREGGRESAPATWGSASVFLLACRSARSSISRDVKSRTKEERTLMHPQAAAHGNTDASEQLRALAQSVLASFLSSLEGRKGGMELES
jgi:hypothetical protein